jgi:hypothetical protein
MARVLERWIDRWTGSDECSGDGNEMFAG